MRTLLIISLLILSNPESFSQSKCISFNTDFVPTSSLISPDDKERANLQIRYDIDSNWAFTFEAGFSNVLNHFPMRTVRDYHNKGSYFSAGFLYKYPHPRKKRRCAILGAYAIRSTYSESGTIHLVSNTWGNYFQDFRINQIHRHAIGFIIGTQRVYGKHFMMSFNFNPRIMFEDNKPSNDPAFQNNNGSYYYTSYFIPGIGYGKFNLGFNLYLGYRISVQKKGV